MPPDWSRGAKPFSGTERPPKYYLNDFDRSIRFSSNDLSPCAQPVWRGDHDRPPEIVDANAECEYYETLFYRGALEN